MCLNFVAIDFETAAPKWDTVCAIAMARVHNGAIVDEYSTLVNPECDFGHMQMRVNGITPLMVADAPTFPQIARDVLEFIGDDILVAHNIPFDGNVLQRVLVKYGIPVPEIRTFCTLACSYIYDSKLPNHRLPVVCNAYGVKLDHHHDAGADSRACAEIMIAMANRMEADTLEDVARALHITFGRIAQGGVFAPKMANGKPIYIASANAPKAANPFTLLEDLRAMNPDIANEITIEQLKDGRTISFKSSGSLLFYLTIGSSTTFIKAADLDDPNAITPRASMYKDGAAKLPVDSSFAYDAFVQVMGERCMALYNANMSSTFGCCNDFLLCSDALKCIKSDDPYYKGCMYRKNLEAGIVFYGKNRTI